MDRRVALLDERRPSWLCAVHPPSALDLPRFRGGLRAWDQGVWSDGILLSCLVPFFCSAPGGAILPSRPARGCGRRAERRSRTAHLGATRRACPRATPDAIGRQARQTRHAVLLPA